MAGSGRVTLRNRRFLREILPLVRCYKNVEDIQRVPEALVNKAEYKSSITIEIPEDEGGLRKSDRIRRPSDCYEAKW